ncbi:cysteine desulfurase [Patescibacteria group bacterium]
MLNSKIRDDFPILKTKVNGKPLIYLDNCATSQKPQVVIDKLVEYYTKTNANIHRGIHYLSEKATEEYEESKRKVVKFINASSDKEVIYTRNTTESINLIAYSWGLENLKKGDTIISTEIEHHSNIVPWQLLAEKTGANLEFVEVKDNFEFDLDHYQELLQKNAKFVAIVHSSNVIGVVNPIKKMVKLAHDAGAKVLVDAAQSAPHMKLDVQDIGCDFLAFSSHKMCGPTGIGVLFGKSKILEEMPPFLAGGDMIKKVEYEKSTWNKLPWKFEAGTPNIADSIAFGTTIDYLESIGMTEIEKHERELTSYALDKMKKVKGLEVFGLNDTPMQRGGMISFTLKNAHPHDIAQILNEDGIAIRSGHHCAQPLHNKFQIPATARISFYIYNTKEEIDKTGEALKKVVKMFS